MVEVFAEILRGPGSPVYLTGEEIECMVTFRNIVNDKPTVTATTTAATANSTASDTESVSSVSSKTSSKTNSKKDTSSIQSQPKESKIKVLAWACAQISCQCYLNDTKVTLPKARLANQKEMNDNSIEKNTSFVPNKGENAILIYSSKPKILFCDLKLEPNGSKSYLYKEKLPYDLPPSYRGQFVKYVYRISIGTQQLNCGTQTLRIPFRVIAIKDFHKQLAKFKCESSVYLNEKPNENNNENGEEKDSNNPFLIVDKNKEENLEFILEILQELTARRSPSGYNITNSNGRVVKLTLFKLDYKIGDEVIGILDFSEVDVSCVEYMVTLYSEEQVLDECKKKPNQGNNIESHSFHKEFVLFMKNTSFTLQIPVIATPTFNSDIVSLQWKLHFDFMVSPTKIPSIQVQADDDTSSESIWQMPSTLNTEKMSWTLPITVHPTSPLTLSNVSGVTEINRLVL